MRRDRTGELVDDDDQADTPASTGSTHHHCDRGWLDHDTDLPHPCPTCKPHLAARVNEARTRQAQRRQERAELDTARQHGLRHRHQQKLAHLATQQPSTPDGQP